MRQRYVPELQGLEARHVPNVSLGPARPDLLADAALAGADALVAPAEDVDPVVAGAPEPRPDAGTSPADPAPPLPPSAERAAPGPPAEKPSADDPAPARKTSSGGERGSPGRRPAEETPAGRGTGPAGTPARPPPGEASDAEPPVPQRGGGPNSPGGRAAPADGRTAPEARGAADGRAGDVPPGKAQAGAGDRRILRALVCRPNDFGAPDGGAGRAKPSLGSGSTPAGDGAAEGPAGDAPRPALGLPPVAVGPRDGDALGDLLPDLRGGPAGAPLPAAGPAERQQGRFGEGGEVPPWYLAAFLPRTGEPHDPAARGYEYLCNYARSAIRTAERRVGPLRDHDDIVQQVALEWLEQVGPAEEAFPRLLEQAPAEMQALRDAVNRVIARAIYRQKKQEVVLDFTDWPAPPQSAAGAWAEFRCDCEKGVGGLTPLEWHILDARRQGKTFEEIGAELKLSKQRACEVCHAAIARLQKIYRTEDA